MINKNIEGNYTWLAFKLVVHFTYQQACSIRYLTLDFSNIIFNSFREVWWIVCKIPRINSNFPNKEVLTFFKFPDICWLYKFIILLTWKSWKRILLWFLMSILFSELNIRADHLLSCQIMYLLYEALTSPIIYTWEHKIQGKK